MLLLNEVSSASLFSFFSFYNTGTDRSNVCTWFGRWSACWRCSLFIRRLFSAVFCTRWRNAGNECVAKLHHSWREIAQQHNDFCTCEQFACPDDDESDHGTQNTDDGKVFSSTKHFVQLFNIHDGIVCDDVCQFDFVISSVTGKKKLKN